MKKFLVLLITLVAVMLNCALADKTSGNYEYVLLKDGTAKITRYIGNEEKLIVPDELDGHQVSGAKNAAFKDLTNLTYISLPDSITSIGGFTFVNCPRLTAISLPNSLTSIGENAFYNCPSLITISLPDSITSIGENTLSNIKSLTSINVSPDNPVFASIDGVLFLKPEKKLICFPRANSTHSYSVPQGILSIGNAAFYQCTSLTSITIPNSVTSIGDSAFFGCKALTSITIPDSVTTIGDSAFSNCDSLTSITIPASVIAIGDNAFDGCSPLKIFIVPRNSYARQYCIDNRLPYTYADANDWLLN